MTVVTKPQSYGGRLHGLSQERPHDVGLVFAREAGGDESFDFAELEAFSNRVARYLASCGVGEESLVVMAMPNSPELVVTCYATWKLGACTLPLNPKIPARERNELFSAASESGRRRFVIGEEGRDDVDATREDLAAAAELDDAPLPDRTPLPGKAIGSGGSTGRPKIIVDPRPWVAVPLPPGHVDPFGRRLEDVVLIGGPLYHNGPFGPLFAALFDGARVVLMERFVAERAVELIEKYRVGWTFMVPTQMARIARLPDVDQRDLGSLDGLYHSGGSCPDWLKRRWIELIGAERLVEVFGSAEAVGATFIRGDEWLAHPGTVGRGAAAEIRIIDADGNDLAPGEVGEIYFRWKPSADGGFLAPQPHADLMYTYWGSPRMKTTPDGFGCAGDMGWLDEEGYLHLADRRSDLIISGGSNVYPAEVEGVITAHPAVADCAVIGLPDDDWGQRVHAVVQCTPGTVVSETELKDWCRGRLSPYKVPKAFEWIGELPRQESGKLRRTQLAAERPR